MVGNCDGFVGNRMIAPYAAEANNVCRVTPQRPTMYAALRIEKMIASGSSSDV